jgi:hypothetical protein
VRLEDEEPEPPEPELLELRGAHSGRSAGLTPGGQDWGPVRGG